MKSNEDQLLLQQQHNEITDDPIHSKNLNNVEGVWTDKINNNRSNNSVLTGSKYRNINNNNNNNNMEDILGDTSVVNHPLQEQLQQSQQAAYIGQHQTQQASNDNKGYQSNTWQPSHYNQQIYSKFYTFIHITLLL